MAMGKCIEEVRAALGGDPLAVTTKAARELLERVEARAGAFERSGMDPLEATARAGREVLGEAEVAAAIEKRNTLLNLQKRVGRREALEVKAKALGGKRGVDLVRAIRNQLVSINTYQPGVLGGRRSVSGDRDTVHLQYVGGAVRELSNAGLFQAARSNQIERLWGRELYELSRRDAGRPSQVGVTGSAEAGKIAAILHKYASLARSQVNREGAWIGDYAGYITRTAHNVDKMRRAGFQSWADFVTPLLDLDRTFQGRADRDGVLHSVYNALRSGVHLSDAGGVGVEEPQFTGPANLAEKLSEHRILIFKDGETWLDYQNRFGNGTLLEQTMESFRRAAQARALMGRFGTNPELEFQQDIRWAKERFRDSNLEAVEELNRNEKSLQNIFDEMSGTAHRPANELLAKIGSYTRLDQTMAKLGGVALTHMSAAVSKAALLRYHGVGLLAGYSDFLAAPFRNMSRGVAGRWADEMLAGMEGTNRDIISGFSPNDALPGTASKLANLYFRLNGLTWLLNKQKAGAEWVMSRQLGRVLDMAHADLAPPTQRLLAQYGISPAEWDMLRKAPDHVAIDGRQFLTPGAAMRVPASEIAADLRARGVLKAEQGALPLLPPVAAGSVRFFHGGQPYEGGSRFVTEDRAYAQGYANKSPGGFVHYVDVPLNHPDLANVPKSFDDTGTNMRAPFVHFDAPPSIAKGLRPVEEMSPAATLAVDRARDDLALKVHGMFRDLADQSVVTPTIEDRAAFTQGLRPGTVGGEVARFIAQFKMWPLAAARQMWGRELYGGQSMAGKMAGMMNLAVGSMLTGYAIMTLKGLLKGQNPRPPDAKAALAGMMQGGGFGIFGDYMFGEVNRFGQGLTDTIAGPVLGATLNNAFDMFNRAKAYAEGDESKRGIVKDLLADSVKLTVDNAPFINLNPARQALNYLFLHSLQEWISPGYLQRQQNAAKRQQGITYFLSPQAHLHTLGR
jgi:hypothetical protein